MNEYKININGVNEPISVDCDGFLQIIIENPKLLYNVLNQLSNPDISDEYICFYNGKDEALSSSAIDFVYDVYNLDINNKKNSSALSKKLNKTLLQTNIEEQINNINGILLNILKTHLIHFELPLTIDDSVHYSEYLELFNVRLVDDNKSLLEKITNYMSACSFLRRINLFIFANIRNLLSKEDIGLLIKDSLYKKYTIVFIDDFVEAEMCTNERRFIIDDSLLLLQ